MNQWINEPRVSWINEIYEWATSLLSYFFTDHCIAARRRANAFCHTAVSCTICGLDLPKVLRAPHFFLPFGKFWKCKSSSRYSPVRCLSTTFPDRGPHPLKQRPFFGDTRSQTTRQTNIGGFRAQTCFHPWIHTRLTWWVVMWWCVVVSQPPPRRACLVGHQSDMVSLGLVQGCFRMYWGLLRVGFRVGLRFPQGFPHSLF